MEIEALTIARNGESQAVVVWTDDANRGGETCCSELASFLQQINGGTFKKVCEPWRMGDSPHFAAGFTEKPYRKTGRACIPAKWTVPGFSGGEKSRLLIGQGAARLADPGFRSRVGGRRHSDSDSSNT